MAASERPAMAVPATATRRCKHGFFMYPRGDVYVGRCLELYGEYSEGEVALFSQLVPQGGTVVEVGANIGALTVPLAHMTGPQGRVIAFEPQRPIFNVLCANLALNGLIHVEAVRAAVGAGTGQVEVPLLAYEDRSNFGGVSVGHAGQRASEMVPVLPLDGLKLSRLDFIKIDVEGFETDVVAGASSVIRQFRPALFVENDRKEHSPRLISMIQELGYKLWWHFSPLFRPENFNGNPENVVGRIISINMLALPEERATNVQGLRPVSGPDDWWKAE
ncbi:MAG: FkbM family methyltransferase [Bacteroidales bacterium]